MKKDSVSLEKGHNKIYEFTLDDQAIRYLSEDELHYIKQSLSEAAYLKTGNPTNIDELSYNTDCNLVIARGLGYYHCLELDKEGFERSPETRELLSDVRAAEREHRQVTEDCGYFESMVGLAIDQRDKDILIREIDIDNASLGLEGLWNKLTGKIPEPYPTLEEMPLTREELGQAFYGCKVETDSFQELFNEYYADIQEDPRVAIQNLDNVLNESRERLDNLTLQASEALNAERAERIERQIEIQDRIAESSRQEELNHNLSQDERTLDEPKLSQPQEIDQSRQDEIKGFYDNRLNTINEELQAINEARQAESYWDQSSDIINADMALANQLTAERDELYQVLEQSPQEQQAYLEAHPELEKTFDSRVTDEDLAKLN